MEEEPTVPLPPESEATRAAYDRFFQVVRSISNPRLPPMRPLSDFMPPQPRKDPE